MYKKRVNEHTHILSPMSDSTICIVSLFLLATPLLATAENQIRIVHGQVTYDLRCLSCCIIRDFAIILKPSLLPEVVELTTKVSLDGLLNDPWYHLTKAGHK